jgi:hypothetical protein
MESLYILVSDLVAEIRELDQVAAEMWPAKAAPRWGSDSFKIWD